MYLNIKITIYQLLNSQYPFHLLILKKNYETQPRNRL